MEKGSLVEVFCLDGSFNQAMVISFDERSECYTVAPLADKRVRWKIPEKHVHTMRFDRVTTPFVSGSHIEVWFPEFRAWYQGRVDDDEEYVEFRDGEVIHVSQLSGIWRTVSGHWNY